MDLNGDGRISFDEMERFYKAMMANLTRSNIETLTFNNLVNMVKFFLFSKLAISIEILTYRMISTVLNSSFVASKIAIQEY